MSQQETTAPPRTTITVREFVDLIESRTLTDDFVSVATSHGLWTVERWADPADEVCEPAPLPPHEQRYPLETTTGERLASLAFDAATALLTLVGRVLR